jgi:hypothetical protein
MLTISGWHSLRVSYNFRHCNRNAQLSAWHAAQRCTKESLATWVAEPARSLWQMLTSVNSWCKVPGKEV